MKKKIIRWLELNSSKEVKFFLLFLTLYFSIRAILAHYLLPYYSIDENEVVESAVGFVVGDLDPRFYKYGFLTSYILAVIYKIYAVFISIFSSNYIDSDSVLYGVYFKRYEYYYMARFLQSIFNFFSILLLYKIARLYINKRTAWIFLALMIIPIMEYHVSYTVRVDSILGFCFILTTYLYIRYLDLNNKIYLYGLFVALALAFSSKPMPALFSFIVLLYPFIKSNDKIKFIGKFLAIFFLTSLIVNPYFLIKFKAFYQYNYNALFGFQVGSETMKAYAFGYEFYWIKRYEISFIVITIISLIIYVYALIKDLDYSKKKMVLFNTLLIPITYIFCFSMFNTRYYWFIIAIPFIVFLWSFTFDYFANKFNVKSLVFYPVVIVISVILLLPVVKSNLDTINKVINYNVGMIDFTPEAEKKIPNKANVLFIGFQSRSPLMFHYDINKEAGRGQYFMYHRSENKGYVQHFVKAHRDNSSKKKMFNLISPSGNYYDGFKGDKNEKLIYEDMVEFCRKNKIEYIVATSHNKEHISVWESDPNVEKIVDSKDLNELTYGPHSKLFKVNIY
jgi:hypothetical protein